MLKKSVEEGRRIKIFLSFLKKLLHNQTNSDKIRMIYYTLHYRTSKKEIENANHSRDLKVFGL